MTRNKNNPKTGDRGELPTPLVGKLFALERRTQKLEDENAELKKKLEAPPAPAPSSPAPDPPEPKPKAKKEEPAPAPAPKPKAKAWESLFKKE